MKGLRKPTVSAWVVNQLVRREPDMAEALLQAGEGLRDAQEGLASGGAGPDDLREAAEQQREAVAGLVDRSADLGEQVALTETTLDRVRETLRATALDEETRRRVEAGRLSHEASGVGLGLVPGVEGETDEEEEEVEEEEESAAEEEPAAVSTTVREAEDADAAAIGRLLHDFNTEYDEDTPGPDAVAARIRELLGGGDLVVLIGGEGPDGLAVLRFRPSIWSEGLECYLAELYVVPDLRGHGLGRALMEAAMDRARREGADHMDLGTSDDDVAARGLYESLGFINREGGPDGPLNYFYEREL